MTPPDSKTQEVAEAEALRASAEVDGDGDGGDGARVQELEKENAELQDQLLRARAEFENFRKRASRERQDARAYGHEALARDLLDALDNLERALAHIAPGDALREGLELVQRDLLAALERHGVREMEAAGARFDPKLHEAMAQVADAQREPGVVLEVLQKGYHLRDRLLRPARVTVTTTPPPPAEASNNDNADGDDDAAADTDGADNNNNVTADATTVTDITDDDGTDSITVTTAAPYIYRDAAVTTGATVETISGDQPPREDAIRTKAPVMRHAQRPNQAAPRHQTTRRVRPRRVRIFGAAGGS